MRFPGDNFVSVAKRYSQTAPMPLGRDRPETEGEGRPRDLLVGVLVAVLLQTGEAAHGHDDHLVTGLERHDWRLLGHRNVDPVALLGRRVGRAVLRIAAGGVTLLHHDPHLLDLERPTGSVAGGWEHRVGNGETKIDSHINLHNRMIAALIGVAECDPS